MDKTYLAILLSFFIPSPNHPFLHPICMERTIFHPAQTTLRFLKEIVLFIRVSENQKLPSGTNPFLKNDAQALTFRKNLK